MSVLAHGGTAGLIVELAVVVGILALAAAVWTSTLRDREDDEESSKS